MKKQICVLGSKEQVIHLLKECSGKYSASEMKHTLKAGKHLNMLAPYCCLQVLASVILYFLKSNIYCFIKKMKKYHNVLQKITNIGDDVEKLEPWCTAGRTEKWCKHYEKQFGGFSKN